jgi:hypothetical protein
VHRERVQLSSGKLNVSAFAPFVDLLEKHRLVEFSSSQSSRVKSGASVFWGVRDNEIDVTLLLRSERKKKFSPHTFLRGVIRFRSHDTIALATRPSERKREVKKTDAV